MAKIIRNFSMNLDDMAAVGGSRSFSVEGDSGAIFSLEIKNEDDYYYNFDTSAFAATRSRLKQKAIGNNGRYSGNVTFPSITDNDQYDIYLFAESAYDTIHANYAEIRFGDDSIDINSSRGSNSNLIQKVIYQYTDTTITIDPRFTYLSGDTPSWFLSRVTDTIVVGRGKNSGKQSFSCTVLANTGDAIQILRQPVENDFIKEIDVRWESTHVTSGGAAVPGAGFIQIQGEDPWAEAASRSTGSPAIVDGQTRGNSTTNGDFSAGTTKIIVDALPTGTQVGDRITGWIHDTTGFESALNSIAGYDNQVVTISAVNPDGDNANEFSVDMSLSDEDTLKINDGFKLYFNAPYYHRYKTRSNIANSVGVLGLKTGMKEAAALNESNPTVTSANGGSRPNTLGPYEDSTTYTTEIVNDDGSITEQTNKTINISYPAIDTAGFKPTITNGKVIEQHGILTFTSPQKIDTAVGGLEGNTWFIARGMDWIKSIHNTEIKISNLKFELTAPTTTTTSSVSGSTSIPVADREGVINGISTISGIGIDSEAVNPTIASGGGADGAGTWVASAAQTLESGITLTVNGTSRNVTITGDIEVTNCGDSDFTIIMDVVGPLTGG